MLARARDRRKSARRRTGYDRDRVDARYRIADDRGAWRHGAKERRGLLRPRVARNRKLSQIGTSERAVSVRMIALRRSNIAHLRRPWRAGKACAERAGTVTAQIAAPQRLAR